VYCHGSRGPPFPGNNSTLVNRADGVELHWRCTCGQTGVVRFLRSPSAASARGPECAVQA